MSEWTANDRIKIIAGVERIADALEQRFPPSPKTNEDEGLGARCIDLANQNVRLRGQVDQAAATADADRKEAAALVLERDRCLHALREASEEISRLKQAQANRLIGNRCQVCGSVAESSEK
jgi:hypothetical protein